MTIWKATLDNVYQCKVFRTGDYTGVLTITNDDVLLYSSNVHLSYGATFGPDISDVAEWENICVHYVDNRSNQ